MPASPPLQDRIVRHYGRGSVLAVLSLPIALVMAAAGMNGWQRSAILAMEKDASALQKLGYRVAATDARSIPRFGVVDYVVTYVRDGRAATPVELTLGG